MNKTTFSVTLKNDNKDETVSGLKIVYLPCNNRDSIKMRNIPKLNFLASVWLTSRNLFFYFTLLLESNLILCFLFTRMKIKIFL